MNPLPFTGTYGCEVGGTITTGVLLYCIHCDNEIIAEWTSRQKFPRLQELINAWDEHRVSGGHNDTNHPA